MAIGDAERGTTLERALLAERERLVRWCVRLTGDPDAAEDLVQETAAAAWRSRRAPGRADEYPAWLAGIARNMCRSWRRRRRREAGHTAWLADGAERVPGAEALAVADPCDLEAVLERDELALLLDRAMARLPADTRRALIARYVEASPLAEVAARLGMSEGAVAARLHRGKLTLRRVLSTDLRAEAASYGLVRPDGDGWQQTRIWCPDCGTHRLLGRMTPERGEFALRCPGCYERSRTNLADWADRALFRGLTSYRVALSRLGRTGHALYRHGLREGTAPCTRCGRPAVARRTRADELPRGVDEPAGVLVRCAPCKADHVAGLGGLLLCHPQVQRFWRAHPRLQTLPAREVVAAGRPAFLTSFLSRTDGARLDVLSDRATLDVLRMEGPDGPDGSDAAAGGADGGLGRA